MNGATRKIAFQIANIDFCVMKYAGCQRAVNAGRSKRVIKVLQVTGAPGSDQRHIAIPANKPQLSDIVTLPDPVLVHAVEHNFSRTPVLPLDDPLDRRSLCVSGLRGIPGIPVDTVALIAFMAVDAEHDALRTEAPGEIVNQRRVFESWGIDGNLISALVQYLLCICNGSDASRNTEWNVDDSSHSVDPAPINRASIRAGSNVVKHEFIGAFVAVPLGQRDNIADDTMIAESNALDDLSVTNVKAGYYSLCRNDRTSSAVIAPSSSARPVMAAGMPASLSAARSATSRTPPDACSSRAGNRRNISP